MAPDIPHRREADQVLPLILQRLDRQDHLSDEWRAKADQNHNAILTKLESLPVMAITQASHGKRLDDLEPRVATTERRMDRAKWTLVGAFGSGGILGAGGTKALLAWLASIGHP